MSETPRCDACLEVGALHCAHPEDCGNMRVANGGGWAEKVEAAAEPRIIISDNGNKTERSEIVAAKLAREVALLLDCEIGAHKFTHTQLTDTQAALSAAEQRAEAMGREIHIVFDGPPSHESGRFVEVEDASGKSISAGEWEQRGEFWHLILNRRA